jgi:hypothetical protein
MLVQWQLLRKVNIPRWSGRDGGLAQRTADSNGRLVLAAEFQ